MVCKNCGASFSKEDNMTEGGIVVCPDCGKRYLVKSRPAPEPAAPERDNAPERPSEKAPARNQKSAKKLSRKAVILGASALAVIAVTIILLVIFLGGNDKYKFDIPETFDRIYADRYGDEYYEEYRQELEEVRKSYEKLAEYVFIELDDGNIYASCEIDSIDPALNALERGRSATYNYTMRWQDMGGIVELRVKAAPTAATRAYALEDWEHEQRYYAEYYSDYGFEDYFNEYFGGNESTLVYSYTLSGKNLTVYAEDNVLSFARASGSKGLSGSWDVDIASLKKLLINETDLDEYADIINPVKLGSDEYATLLLNSDGTLGAKIRLRIGTYTDDSISLRSEIQDALRTERDSLGIKYESKGGKLYLTLSYYHNNQPEGTFPIVLKKA